VGCAVVAVDGAGSWCGVRFGYELFCVVCGLLVLVALGGMALVLRVWLQLGGAFVAVMMCAVFAVLFAGDALLVAEVVAGLAACAGVFRVAGEAGCCVGTAEVVDWNGYRVAFDAYVVIGAL